MSKDEYLITDAPLKALTVFAMPMILGSFFQQVYNMADSIIVGQFVGSSALAAVGACAALTNVFICVALGAGVGAGVLVSRYFGAKNYGKMKTDPRRHSGGRGAVSAGLFCGLSVFVHVQHSFHHVYLHWGIQDPAGAADLFLHPEYFYGSLDGGGAWLGRVWRSPCHVDRTGHFCGVFVFDLPAPDAAV